jgi:hypothetical protein
MGMSLLDSVKILSLEAEDQISYLESHGFVDSADELALQFDDLYNFGGSAIGGVSEPIAHLLEDLYVLLTNMTNSKDNLWNFESLKNSNEWKKIRIISRDILNGWL